MESDKAKESNLESRFDYSGSLHISPIRTRDIEYGTNGPSLKSDWTYMANGTYELILRNIASGKEVKGPEGETSIMDVETAYRLGVLIGEDLREVFPKGRLETFGVSIDEGKNSLDHAVYSARDGRMETGQFQQLTLDEQHKFLEGFYDTFLKDRKTDR